MRMGPGQWIAFGAVALVGILALTRLLVRLAQDAEQLARRLRTQRADLTRRGDHLGAELQITRDRLARFTRRRPRV